MIKVYIYPQCIICVLENDDERQLCLARLKLVYKQRETVVTRLLRQALAAGIMNKCEVLLNEYFWLWRGGTKGCCVFHRKRLEQ